MVVEAVPLDHMLARRERRLCDQVPHPVALCVIHHERHMAGLVEREADRNRRPGGLGRMRRARPHTRNHEDGDREEPGRDFGAALNPPQAVVDCSEFTFGRTRGHDFLLEVEIHDDGITGIPQGPTRRLVGIAYYTV